MKSQKSKVKSQKFEKGQTLLEVIIALVAGTIVIGAVVLLVITSLSNQRFGTSQNQATQYAQEGLDVFREMAQADWQSFITSYTGPAAITWCVPSDTNNIWQLINLTQGCGKNVGDLVRQVTTERNICSSVTPGPTPSGGVIGWVRLTSVVKWTDGKCTGTYDARYCHSTKLVTCVFR